MTRYQSTIVSYMNDNDVGQTWKFLASVQTRCKRIIVYTDYNAHIFVISTVALLKIKNKRKKFEHSNHVVFVNSLAWASSFDPFSYDIKIYYQNIFLSIQLKKCQIWSTIISKQNSFTANAVTYFTSHLY